MPFTGYERISVSGTVLDVNDLTVPDGTTYVELQSDTQNVRYTMDGSTDPAQASGMIFLVTANPVQFSVEDVKNMRFVRGAGSNGALNLHYFR